MYGLALKIRYSLVILEKCSQQNFFLTLLKAIVVWGGRSLSKFGNSESMYPCQHPGSSRGRRGLTIPKRSERSSVFLIGSHLSSRLIEIDVKVWFLVELGSMKRKVFSIAALVALCLLTLVAAVSTRQPQPQGFESPRMETAGSQRSPAPTTATPPRPLVGKATSHFRPPHGCPATDAPP